MREYARVSGLQLVGGSYDITPAMVDDWRSSPPSVRGARDGWKPRRVPKLDGPPILEDIRGLETPAEKARRMLAREGRKERLMVAIRRLS